MRKNRLHFEVLVEDKSGKRMLDIIIPKIINTSNNSFRVISYKGIGSVPKNLKTSQNASKRILLEQLPRLLSGYGRTYKNSKQENAIIVVCDLDNKDKKQFLLDLDNILTSCKFMPNCRFCLAIEECEAWMMGDIDAIKQAYPKADKKILFNYTNDSICGTWELLADAIYKGGSQKLKKLGYIEIGTQKSLWAEKICPNMNVLKNKSPSFNFFKDRLQELAKS